MSIYGKKNFERQKVIINDKVYENTLGVLDNTYVPPYNGGDMRKVKPINEKKEEQEQERQM